MDKIRNFLDLVKNLIKRKKNTVDKKEKADTSLDDELAVEAKNDTIDNKIEEPPTSTVNKAFIKKAVLIVFAFVIAGFLGSSYVSSDDTQKNARVEVATNRDNEVTKDIDENYVNLAKREQEKAKKLNVETEKNNTKTVQSDTASNNSRTDYGKDIGEDTNTGNVYRQNNPAIPNYNPYMRGVSPYNPYTSMQIQQQINKKEETADTKDKQKDIYGSAIAFISETNTDTTSNTNKKESSSLEDNIMDYTPPTENSILAGTGISAILLNGINSQTKGQIMAQIQSNVYDSLNGINVLIPAGTKIIGSYASGAKEGQNRVDVDWKTLIMPSGASYNVEGVFQSADLLGYPGIPGDVNNHNGSKISAGAFSSALAALGSIATGNNSYGDDYGWHNSGQLAMQGASANLLNTASEIFKQKLEMEPEITVEPGTAFSLYLTQTISF